MNGAKAICHESRSFFQAMSNLEFPYSNRLMKKIKLAKKYLQLNKIVWCLNTKKFDFDTWHNGLFDIQINIDDLKPHRLNCSRFFFVVQNCRFVGNYELIEDFFIYGINQYITTTCAAKFCFCFHNWLFRFLSFYFL